MKTTRMTMLILAALAVTVLVVAPTVGAVEKAAKPAATAAPAASVSKMAREEVTVMGTIVETKNAEGKVSGCMLEQADGQSMRLSNQGMGMKLGKMVGKKVKVVGTLEEAKGVKTITATEFKEIK
jgi:predicted porin